MLNGVYECYNRAQAHVFEHTIKLPKFASFVQDNQLPDPASYAQFPITERVERVSHIYKCIYK